MNRSRGDARKRDRRKIRRQRKGAQSRDRGMRVGSANRRPEKHHRVEAGTSGLPGTRTAKDECSSGGSCLTLDQPTGETLLPVLSVVIGCRGTVALDELAVVTRERTAGT